MDHWVQTQAVQNEGEMSQFHKPRHYPKKQTILETFLKALCEHYSTDSVAPGIVVSWLGDRRLYYCSVRRYSLHTHALRSNVIVAAASKHSMEAALGLAMKKWQDEVKNPRQSNLKLFMSMPFDVEDTQGVNWNGAGVDDERPF